MGQAGDAELVVLRRVAADAYELGRELFRGSASRVVEAVDLRHQRPVALKLLLDPAAEEALVREVTITARLQHPSVIAVNEAGILPSGEAFYAMPLVRGRSLAEAAAAIASPAERLRLLPHLLAACDAVAYAHGEGLVHGELAAAHILVGELGETVIIDWGQAREGADARADVRALGALMRDVLGASSLPADLAAIIEAAAAGRPAASALAADLRAFAAGELVSAYRYPWTARLARFARRHLAAVTAAAVLGLALLITVGVAVSRVVRERDAAVTARALAERHDVAAGKLVTFMLSTLGEKLRAIDKLELLAGVADEVERYHAGVGPSAASVEVARLLALVRGAQVRRAAATVLERQAQALPPDGARALAAALDELAAQARAAGELEESLRFVMRALTLRAGALR